MPATRFVAPSTLALVLGALAPPAAAQILTERAPTTSPTIMSDATPPVVSSFAIPAGVGLSWQPVTNASGYTLCRETPPGSTTCTVLTASQLPATTLKYYDFGLPPGGTHAYRVSAWRSDGHYGTAAPVTGTAGVVSTPTNFVVKYDSSNAATPVIILGWDGISYWKTGGEEVRVTSYRLSGTGLSAPQMVNATSYRVVLGSGDHNWSLTAMVPNPAGGWYESATPTTTSFKALVKYRLVALGFKVLHQANELLTDTYGEGNEVFAAAMVASTTTALATPATYVVRGASFGDVKAKGAAGRLQAGSATRFGGIVTNDVVPAGLDLQGATGTVSTTAFPMLLWEGRLSSTGMIVVHPTLWEEDGDAAAYNKWVRSLQGHAAVSYARQTLTLPAITGLRDAGLLGPRQGDPVLVCRDHLVLPVLGGFDCDVNGHDRPLGLVPIKSLLEANWYDKVLVLTQASIEAALRGTGTRPGTAPGVIVVPLLESGVEATASYELYLRVERLP